MRKGLTVMMLVMIVSLLIASMWDKFPIIKNIIHGILDPTFGRVLNLNLTLGFIFVIFIITLITTLIQKYTTDQVALKNLKAEQKSIQEEMKKYSNDPNKMMELQKKQMMENFPKTFDLTMKPLIFTAVPIILLFRWFMDIFKNLGNPHFLGFLSWIWFYIIISLVFSLILRKILKVE